MIEKNLIDLQYKQNSLLNWFVDDRSQVLELDGQHRPIEIGKYLASSQAVLNTNITPSKGSDRLIKQINQFDPGEYLLEADSKYRESVVEIYQFVNERLSPFLKNFILHGSLATRDYVKGWSDVDTFVVLRSEIVANERKINSFRQHSLILRRMFYEICPLQHHGLIAFTETDLKNYPPHFMPIEVLNEGVELLYNAEPLEIYLQEKTHSDSELIQYRLSTLKSLAEEAVKTGVLCHHPYKGECLKAEFRNADNAMYQLFWLLGNVMTMPAYLMSGIGKSCPKRVSFEKVQTFYSSDSWDFIDRASQIRKNWEFYEYGSFAGNAIPNWVIDILGADYLKCFDELIGETLEIINSQKEEI